MLDLSRFCYDCGGALPHHTKSCDMVGKGEPRDLPNIPNTQWWDYNASQATPELEAAAAERRR